MGIPALDIVGWVQPPKYDASQHQLIWSMKATSRGAAAGETAIINYNTYALGRDGYFKINLLTDDQHVESDKVQVHDVIKDIEYLDGKSYANFDASTDHVAEYGLAALVGGVVAKKLGLLAVAGVFFAKFAKIILLALAAGGAVVFKIFRRKSSE